MFYMLLDGIRCSTDWIYEAHFLKFSSLKGDWKVAKDAHSIILVQDLYDGMALYHPMHEDIAAMKTKFLGFKVGMTQIYNDTKTLSL